MKLYKKFKNKNEKDLKPQLLNIHTYICKKSFYIKSNDVQDINLYQYKYNCIIIVNGWQNCIVWMDAL